MSFLADVIIFNTDKSTGDTTRPHHSSPFSYRDRCVLDTLVDPQAPSSWPPRPDSTGLGQTCVADHVVSFHAQKSSVPLKPHVVTHVVMSLSPSWIVVKAREHERDVVFVFRKTGPCVLKRCIVQKNHVNFTIWKTKIKPFTPEFLKGPCHF